MKETENNRRGGELWLQKNRFRLRVILRPCPLKEKRPSSIRRRGILAGTLCNLLFKADEKKIKALLPPPLEIGPYPGEGVVWFVEWVSVSDSNPDLAFINPERSTYHECIVMVGCQFEGVPGYYVPYIWVDNDFTLMRGFIQGFPKKLGRIHITKLHDLTPQGPARRPVQR